MDRGVETSPKAKVSPIVVCFTSQDVVDKYMTRFMTEPTLKRRILKLIPLSSATR